MAPGRCGQEGRQLGRSIRGAMMVLITGMQLLCRILSWTPPMRNIARPFQSPDPPAAPRSHGWQIRAPHSALWRLPRVSRRAKLALRAPMSTRIGAAGIARCDKSESAVHGSGGRLEDLVSRGGRLSGRRYRGSLPPAWCVVRGPHPPSMALGGGWQPDKRDGWGWSTQDATKGAGLA